MKHTDVVDWRVWKATRVARDAPPVKAGDHLYVISKLQKTPLGDIAFVTPSPVALALNVAIVSAKEASLLRDSLHPEPASDAAENIWIPASQVDALFRFFEQSMIAATFSFQSIEAFANQLIDQGLTGSLRLQWKNGPVDLTPTEVERRCSTPEKIGVVLPEITKAASPKGTHLWEQFVKLKAMRDSAIHLKSRDQYVRGAPDDQTLYYRLLNADPLAAPRCAVAVIKHFSASGSLGWLAGAEALLE